jgi:hypothetical protein
MPLPFQCFYAGEVANSTLVEGKLHRIFADKRIRNNREFFRVDPNQVREAIQLAELRDVTPRVDVVVDAEDVLALKRAVVTEERRARLRFTELNIPTGATLVFAKDENIIALVVTDGKINFEGEVMSPSAAAKIAVKRLGYDWSAVSGSAFWKYEEGTLIARRLRLEDEKE